MKSAAMTKPAARWLILAAAFFGFSGVAIGAAGAHAFPPRWEAQGRSAEEIQRESQRVDTAVKYQLLHAVALLALGAFGIVRPHPLILWVGAGMSLGVLLFSGFLLWHALWSSSVLLSVVPYGGTLLIVSWFGLAILPFRLD